jgi:transcriptional regulator with GAF, ATPase, and Fis domain
MDKHRVGSAVSLVADALSELGADAGFLATIGDDGRTLDVARVTPFSKTPARLSFSLDSPYPLAQAFRTREPLFIASNTRLACDHPGLVRVRSDDHACATLPLLDENGTILGALNIGFEDPHEFTPDERREVAQLADRCVIALTSR